MVSSKIEPNMFYINAPAGSGKTHYIKEEVNRLLEKDSLANILCITYTERAARELKTRIDSDNVYISTIHSFVNFFLTPFYGHAEAIALYYKLYKDNVEQRIQKNNELPVGDPENKNRAYLINKGLDPTTELSLRIIKQNTKYIYYNQKKNNTHYYGGISHDNLLGYAFALLEKYPILRYRIREMYQHIFVDEVQDTDSKILKLFYDAAKDTNIKLYFFGDKMQEIYDKYDGGFENEYSNFNVSLTSEFITNYRSSAEIVYVLNNLYGRMGSDRQDSYNGPNGVVPQIIICPDIDTYFSEKQSELDGYLVLRTSNRARFYRKSPSETMENAFDIIRKIYPDGSRYTPIDVMLPPKGENSPDILVNFLYIFAEIKNKYESGHFAEIITIIREQNYTDDNNVKKNVFCSGMIINLHNDKERVKRILNQVFAEYSIDNKHNLITFMDYLVNLKVIESDFLDHIRQCSDQDGNLEYEQLLNITLDEIKRLYNYKNNQTISTQHGVKGEGHSKVCFWCEDSSTHQPFVYMYDFLRMYSQMESFSLSTFQSFYYEFKSDIVSVEKTIGKRVSKIYKIDITEDVCMLLDRIIDKYSNNPYFNEIFHDNIDDYKNPRSKKKLPTIKSIQALFKYDAISRVLVAYKLFYVGCSRAKDNLIVLVTKDGISSFESYFRRKMKSVGFLFDN